MNINKLLSNIGMSQYLLSKLSGVPQATLSDLCCNKTELDKCSAETLFKISKVVNIPIEELLSNVDDEYFDINEFELFKSNVCHYVSKNDVNEVINEINNKDEIFSLYNSKEYSKAFYLLAMVDYLSRKNNKPLNKKYNYIRMHKLSDVVYPKGVLLLDRVMNTNENKIISKKDSIQEFLNFNIVENDIHAVA